MNEDPYRKPYKVSIKRSSENYPPPFANTMESDSLAGECHDRVVHIIKKQLMNARIVIHGSPI